MKNQHAVQQQHIRITEDGLEGNSEEKEIFTNENC